MSSKESKEILDLKWKELRIERSIQVPGEPNLESDACIPCNLRSVDTEIFSNYSYDIDF